MSDGLLTWALQSRFFISLINHSDQNISSHFASITEVASPQCEACPFLLRRWSSLRRVLLFFVSLEYFDIRPSLVITCRPRFNSVDGRLALAWALPASCMGISRGIIRRDDLITDNDLLSCSGSNSFRSLR